MRERGQRAAERTHQQDRLVPPQPETLFFIPPYLYPLIFLFRFVFRRHSNSQMDENQTKCRDKFGVEIDGISPHPKMSEGVKKIFYDRQIDNVEYAAGLLIEM